MNNASLPEKNHINPMKNTYTKNKKKEVYYCCNNKMKKGDCDGKIKFVKCKNKNINE